VSAVIEYLQGRGAAFTVLPTPQAETSLETAKAHDVPASELAQTVVMNYRYGFAMMIMPVGAELDLRLAQAALDDPDARRATHREVVAHFAGMDATCIPPLGLYFLTPMWVDPEIAGREQISFAAGKPSLIIRMRSADLFRDEPYVVTAISISGGTGATVSVPDVAADIA
jgi:prolyl-tRNA editing enzyme YbaK/EbsC (Cys-tRNA(Pro) deacylase)